MKISKNSYNFLKEHWILSPVIAFIGIIIGFFFHNNIISGYAGVAGCIISSFVLAFTAYSLPKKDIVSLLTPAYAILIFNPWSEFSSGIFMQTVYALTILALAYRLEKLYNS
ncbi:MAG: hypothetical protein PHV39_00430 [Methanomicrobium sp.]|nr:hypothetical protein [Methanomicrobium sp.]